MNSIYNKSIFEEAENDVESNISNNSIMQAFENNS